MTVSALNIRQIVVRLLLGTGISFTMLAVLFYAIPDSDNPANLPSLIEIIKNVTPLAWGSYLLCQIVGTGLRCLRYRCLLDAAADKTKPGIKDLYAVTLVRNMTVDLMPARVGELAFVGLLKRIKSTHASHSLSALVFSTIFDLIILIPIVLILVFFMFGEKQIQITLFSGALIIVLGLMGIYIAMRKLAPWVSEKIALYFKTSNIKWVKSLIEFSLEFNLAIQSTIKGGQFNRVIWLTIGLRIIKYLGLWLLFLGVVAKSFTHLPSIATSELIITLITAEMTASLPVPTFLSLGSYEAGAVGMLTLFGISAGAAFLIMLAVHLCSQFIDYSLGIIGMLWLLLRA